MSDSSGEKKKVRGKSRGKVVSPTDELDPEQKIGQRIVKADVTGILDLSTSILREIPQEVFALNLRQLWLTNNIIPVLSYEVRSLSNLTTLGMTGNQLTGLPSDIGALKNLERLFLDRNKIASIPPELEELKKLVELRLDHNHLHHFPEIAGLRKLRRLGLSFNKLAEIPATVCRLSSLIELDLDNNQIDELPVELARLKSTLQQLGLSNNLLGEKPVFLDKMPKLQIVRLSGNRKKNVHQDSEAMLGGNVPIRHDGYKNTNVEGHLACATEYNFDASMFGTEFASAEYRELLRNRKNMSLASNYAV